MLEKKQLKLYYAPPTLNRAPTPRGSEIDLKTSSITSKPTQIANIELEISPITFWWKAAGCDRIETN